MGSGAGNLSAPHHPQPHQALQILELSSSNPHVK